VIIVGPWALKFAGGERGHPTPRSALVARRRGAALYGMRRAWRSKHRAQLARSDWARAAVQPGVENAMKKERKDLMAGMNARWIEYPCVTRQ
jgi:hypothetical protein